MGKEKGFQVDSFDSVQRRYWTALDAVVARLEQDRYVLAVVLYGSLARGEAWDKSDIDLTIIEQDGLKQDTRSTWLVQDGINIFATVISRNRFKRELEGALQGSIVHSIRSQSKLLFSKDASIVAWFEESERIGARDQDMQLLRAASVVPYYVEKAQKWFCAKHDLDYCFLWIMYVVNNLARVEVVLNGEAPGREAIHQALKINPAFFDAVYVDLIHGPKSEEQIRQALDMIDAYLVERAHRLFKPVLDYLAEANGLCTASDLDMHFRKKVQTSTLAGVYEWLADKQIIEKLAAPLRLTKKSQVVLEEPAYFYDPEPDWEEV
ncbi:MAG: nucleotidyltransferase domain-containing protein [Anaerolineae bacterium]|nr:nucleotidyltransferase domain-containing protein [Anaerolineae bacterium]